MIGHNSLQCIQNPLENLRIFPDLIGVLLINADRCDIAGFDV